MNLFIALKPGIPKRYLLFVAGTVWAVAGGLLLFRGAVNLSRDRSVLLSETILAMAGGVLFYALLFSGISRKHTIRMLGIPHARPCLFSFFNLRSYFLMAVMICMGITLRKLSLVQIDYLSAFYVAMGIPLGLSSVRFFHCGFSYRKCLKANFPDS